MTPTIAKNRNRAASLQGHLCYYCGLPMWESRPIRFGDRHFLSPAQVEWMRCSAEHVVARCEGGGNTKDNIVAACVFCNRNRHTMPAPPRSQTYREYVAEQMAAGEWLAGMMPASFVKKGRIPRGQERRA